MVTAASNVLRRGINFGDSMDAPVEGHWGWMLSAADFQIVRDAGFDHVRVPMRVSAHAAGQPPYAIDARFARRMDWAIEQALTNDLGIVVDMHHYEEMMRDPRGQADRLVGLWRQIATRYRHTPAAVIYEILNEPRGALTAAVWNPILARVIAEIRAIDPTRTLIVESANWASAHDLGDTIEVPAGDPNLVGSFHTYAPMYFTHQGCAWVPEHYGTRGVVFPGPPPAPLVPCPAAERLPEVRDFFDRYNAEPPATNPVGAAAIIEQLELASQFVGRTGLPVYMGEFGASINADLGSRARWTKVARTEAERRGFGWAYWDYARSFAAYARPGIPGHWIAEIRSALLD